jgi:hypothetical protein
MNHLLAGRCEEAAELAAASASVYSEWDATYLVQGMALACVGRTDEATAAMANLARVLSGATLSLYGRALPIRDLDRRARFDRYMRAAGLSQ